MNDQPIFFLALQSIKKYWLIVVHNLIVFHVILPRTQPWVVLVAKEGAKCRYIRKFL